MTSSPANRREAGAAHAPRPRRRAVAIYRNRLLNFAPPTSAPSTGRRTEAAFELAREDGTCLRMEIAIKRRIKEENGLTMRRNIIEYRGNV